MSAAQAFVAPIFISGNTGVLATLLWMDAVSLAMKLPEVVQVGANVANVREGMRIFELALFYLFLTMWLL